MFLLINFIPMLLFIFLFLGSGIYFSLKGVENAFYQISPLVAIIPAIIAGWVLHKENTEARLHAFLNGMRHKDILTMCIIFLLAGAFSEVTKGIGSMEAVVNFSLSLISSQFLIIGLFIISSFISTSIGTSMGTVAAIAPIAVGLCTQAELPLSIGIATVVGGAMFGDNLSIISDSTIAAVMSQEADMKARFKLNAKIAFIAALITVPILLFKVKGGSSIIENGNYSLWLITPYIVLILLASWGLNVFIALLGSLLFAATLGFVICPHYNFMTLNTHITKGFSSMYEIMLLSLLVGGLSGLSTKGAEIFKKTILSWISKWNGGQKMAQLFIAKIVTIFDLLLANNTIAIIFSGEIAREISKKYHIPPHYSAAWLDIFSCVFQGIIPYGAQILLASAISGVSPLSIMQHVYYCYILGAVSIIYILVKRIEKKDLLQI
jgi:Na+/H+ antiporter NhaC